MSAEKLPPPPNKMFGVRLIIKQVGDWFEVSCDVCHSIVVAGESPTLGVTLKDAVERAAPAHMHLIG